MLLKPHVSNMGGPSFEVASIARAFARKHSEPQALDVGSGDGRNCTYLAELGFDVTAIESDRKLSESLAANVALRELAIEVFSDDLRNFIPATKFDVVLFLGILHFVPKSQLEDLLKLHQSSTSSGGVHIITISHNEFDDATSEFMKMQGHINSVDRALVSSAYSSWKELAYERYVKFDCHNDGMLDRHPIEKFVYQNDTSPKLAMNASRIDLCDSQMGRAFFESFSPKMLTNYTYTEINERFGPPDFRVRTEPVGGQYSLLGVDSQYQHIAFWGRTKCYFEGQLLIGLARYDTSVFFDDFSFN